MNVCFMLCLLDIHTKHSEGKIVKNSRGLSYNMHNKYRYVRNVYGAFYAMR